MRWSSASLLLAILPGIASAEGPVQLDPAGFPHAATVDSRFLSYNLEMAELIGARFWGPYRSDGGVPADRFAAREPLDLKRASRLRMLAKALAPAYVRVSGTWANKVWFADRAGPAPTGFEGTLTRRQWASLVGFARSVDARIVTSFAVGSGARDASGAWQPDQARAFLRYNRKIGGDIAAIEPINEANFAEEAGLPAGYGPAQFAADNLAMRQLIAREAPGVRVVGPSATGDVPNFLNDRGPFKIGSEALMAAEPRARFDVYSYHLYTAASKRCAGSRAASADVALSPAWLGVADRVHAFNAGLRDRYAPGAPIWVTEIGQAACGGDPWAATFADVFRFTDNAGRLARSGVAAIFHNTLAASDYALIDGASGEPRPNYWAALLWKRLMGERVLDAGKHGDMVTTYAHCLRGKPGGVALLAINLDRAQAMTISLPGRVIRYRLDAPTMTSSSVRLNGAPLELKDGRLPALSGVVEVSGRVALPPASVTFLALPDAKNPVCS